MELFVFLLVAFGLGFVIISNRDSIPDKLRKPLAIFAIFIVLAAFVMTIVYLFSR